MSGLHLPGVRKPSTNQVHLHGSKTERFNEEIGREQLEIWHLTEENKKLKEQIRRYESENNAAHSEIRLLREQIDQFNVRWEAREGLVEDLQQTIVSLQTRIEELFRHEITDLPFNPSWTKRPADGREQEASRALALKEDRIGSLIKGTLSYRRTMAQRARFAPMLLRWNETFILDVLTFAPESAIAAQRLPACTQRSPRIGLKIESDTAAVRAACPFSLLAGARPRQSARSQQVCHGGRPGAGLDAAGGDAGHLRLAHVGARGLRGGICAL